MEDLKKIAASGVVKEIKDGMVIGLGTGSTMRYVMEEIAKQGLSISAISTSDSTSRLMQKLGIKNASEFTLPIDLTIDGADQVDRLLNLLKGKGGAFLKEKIVASMAKRFYVVVDESKLVDRLSGPVSVEFLKFAKPLVEQRLKDLGAIQVDLRPNLSEHDNLMADVYFKEVRVGLEKEINQIPGVLENGIFNKKLVSKVFVGTKKGLVIKDGGKKVSLLD
jgi:ribose 5-phosphate isomerase A